jgi:hypothetical protein
MVLPACQPVRSIRSQRGVAVRIAIVASIGLLVTFLTGTITNAKKSFINPGDLTAAHSPSDIACSSCHNSLEDTSDIKDVHQRKITDNCLECHSHEIGISEVARNPHGLSDEFLMELKKKNDLRNESEKPFIFAVADTFGMTHRDMNTDSMECAVCHNEHQGRNHDMKTLSNNQCQSCHEKPFSSFAEGHPEFTDYPYKRRSRIFFDHEAHFSQYFANKKSDWESMSKDQGSCNVCHEPDMAGAKMTVKSFDVSCASCHSGLVERGELHVLAFPAMDKKHFASWPKSSPVKPAKINPFTELLLGFHQDNHELVKKFQSIDNTMRLEDHEKDHALQIHDAVHELIVDFQEKGGDQLIQDIEKMEEPLKSLFSTMLSSIPPETFESMLIEFAEAEEAILEKEKEELVKETQPTEVVKSIEAKDEEPLGNLMDLASDDDDSGGLGNLLDLADEDEKGSEMPNDLLSLADDSSGDDSGGLTDLMSLGEDDSNEAPLGNLMDLVSDEGESSYELGGLKKESVSEVVEAKKPKFSKSISEQKSKRLEWAKNSHWKYENLAIVYQQNGHADLVIKNWIDSIAESVGSSDPLIASKAIQMIESPEVSNCLTCHTVDTSSKNSSYTVNWTSDFSNGKGFTKFIHSSHTETPLLKHVPDFLKDVESQTCFTCHQFKKDDFAAYREYFPASDKNVGLKHPIARDPHVFTSTFQSVGMKATCVSCHTPEAAGDSCLKCHNYHVGSDIK